MAIEDHKINHGLQSSYWMGLFRCCMTGFTQDFFTPFLLLLGAGASQVGIMVFCSNFFPSIFQTFSPEAAAKMGSRLKIISLFTLLQVLSLLAIIWLVFGASPKPAAFILPVVFLNIFGAFLNPAWLSMLSDMVRPKRRGTYFGWRNRNLGIITVASTIIAGLILYAMSVTGKRHGFGIIFSIALVFGVLCWLLMKKFKEPPLHYTKEDHFTFWQFIRQYKTSNFVRFTLFVAVVNFCVNLAAPYFPVVMLQDLKFNYLLFSLLNTLSSLASYLAMQRWGRHADRVGNLKIMKVIAPLFCLSPFLWIINQDPVFLVLTEMLSGFLWAGFNLCTSNFILDSVTPAKRTRCAAYFTLITGVGVGTGAICGGYLAPVLPTLFHYKLLTLFLVSGMLRLIVGLWLPRYIKEVRPTDAISSRQLLLSMIGIQQHPM